jgi:tetratricopeptide (TPR) repeat protein
MNGRHFEDWELLALLDENEEAIDRSSVQAHVKGCHDCRMNLDSLRSVHEILADHSVHEFASRPAARPDPARLKEARTLTRQMEQEDRDAETTFRQMTALPIDRWLPHLETRSASRTEGLIRRVVREARAEFDRDPGRALDMLSVAAGIANALQDAFGIANERATIAKERANALRMLGRYREALDELEWAEQFLNDLPTRIFDLALVYWARATVLFSMTRYAEALPLVRRATAILRQFGDLPRARQAGVLEASILLEMGEIDDAESLFGALAEAFKATNDREIVCTFAKQPG